AWEDDDDIDVSIVDTGRLRKLRTDHSETVVSGTEFESRLRRQFEKIYPRPQWADLTEDATESVAGGDLMRVLRSTEGIASRRKSQILSPDKLDIVRVKDANQMAYSQAVVQTATFHPRAPVLMTAGFDKTIRLFQIDGKVNPKLQSIFIRDMPIARAQFTPSGNEVIVTGPRKFFYVYDVESGTVEKVNGIRGREEDQWEKAVVSPCDKYIAFTGRDGCIILISRQTKQWIATMKMNGTVRAIEFSPDGQLLYSFGGDGEVYWWDLATRRCVHRFIDEGCVQATTIAASGNGEYLATGSKSGVVNLYIASSARATSTPAPEKSILNLTTAATTLTFSPDSQILALSSRAKRDSLRLLHVPTRRVFKTWPTASTPLGHVSTVAFSPGGGYCAIGNDKGKVLLYRLGGYTV
ncbi:WD40-repeat-containing domain protein, partial [Blyttiomyces helicus]